MARDELRRIDDPTTLRALAHPVRVRLIERLTLDGPLTATELGELIGETPTTCSFHLRQLAKYDFVEEAGGGKGRARPWRMTSIGLSFGDAGDDPELGVAAAALSALLRQREAERLQTWIRTRAAYPREWQDAATDSENVIYLTPDELVQFNDELVTLLLSRFRERITDKSTRPPGSAPVEFLVRSFPLSPPAPPA